jgi:peptidoglycan/LPS O-acetylase OafA/YrhL
VTEPLNINYDSKTSLPPSKAFWLPELDGMRALAFILVYYHHTIGLFWRDTPGNSALYKVLFYLDQRVHNWGWIGVDLFFVLSAFLITSLLLQERQLHHGNVNLPKFMMRRVLRIWPLYFVYLALVAGLSLALPPGYSGGSIQVPKAWQQLLAFALFIGNFAVIGQGVILHLLNPMWSLCIEEQFYIVWGSCLRFIKSDRVLLAALISSALAAPALRFYLWHLDAKNYLAYYLNSLSHCDAIVFGAMAAFLWRRFGETLKKSMPLQVVCLGFAALLLSPIAWVPYIEESDSSIIWVMSGVAAGFTCLMLATLSNKFCRSFFAHTFLRHIGKLTYGLYMFHFAVIYSTVYVCRNNLNITSRLTLILISWPLCLLVTYCLARLSWRFIENPALALKARFKA